MEWCDILHAVWLGVGRDLCGSLLMHVAAHGDFTETSYDGRLRALHAKCQAWCYRNSIRPSTIEEVSVWHAYIAHMLLRFLLPQPFPSKQEWQTPKMFFDFRVGVLIHNLGLQKLGVDALAYDFPLGPSKAYAIWVWFLGICGIFNFPSNPILHSQTLSYTYIHTYMHACMHACMHIYIYIYNIYIYIYWCKSKYKVWIKGPGPHEIHTPPSIH